MSEPVRYDGRMPSTRGQQQQAPASNSGTNLADILERVLDKGIVIAGDVQINLLDIELLTIKLRLVVASVDKAKEMGIDWWERDPTLSSGQQELQDENRRLRERLEALEGRAAERIEGPTDGEADDVEDAELDDTEDADDADIDDADVVEDGDAEEPADDEPAEDGEDGKDGEDGEDGDAEPEPAPRRKRTTRRESGGSRR